MCLKKDRLFDYVFVIVIHCRIYSLIMEHENEKIYVYIFLHWNKVKLKFS